MTVQTEEDRELRTDQLGDHVQLRAPFTSLDTRHDGSIADHLPTISDELVESYVNLACLRAHVEEGDDGAWYAGVPLLRGAWASGETEEEALRVLRRAVRAWVLVKLRDHDLDIPVIESLDLTRY